MATGLVLSVVLLFAVTVVMSASTFNPTQPPPSGCSSSPCRNGGTCQPVSLRAFYCQCPAGYTGALCSIGTSFNRCYYQGKSYSAGQPFLPSPCLYCMCSGSVANCTTITCKKLTCSNPVRLTGICCPICPSSVPCSSANCDGSCQSVQGLSLCFPNCPKGIPPYICIDPPCQTASCPAFPRAKCVNIRCGGCKAEFYVNSNKVACVGSRVTHPIPTGTPALTCQQLSCTTLCPHGYQYDQNGCPTCTCHPGSTTSGDTFSSALPPIGSLTYASFQLTATSSDAVNVILTTEKVRFSNYLKTTIASQYGITASNVQYLSITRVYSRTNTILVTFALVPSSSHSQSELLSVRDKITTAVSSGTLKFTYTSSSSQQYVLLSSNVNQIVVDNSHNDQGSSSGGSSSNNNNNSGSVLGAGAIVGIVLGTAVAVAVFTALILLLVLNQRRIVTITSPGTGGEKTTSHTPTGRVVAVFDSNPSSGQPFVDSDTQPILDE